MKRDYLDYPAFLDYHEKPLLCSLKILCIFIFTTCLNITIFPNSIIETFQKPLKGTWLSSNKN